MYTTNRMIMISCAYDDEYEKQTILMMCFLFKKQNKYSIYNYVCVFCLIFGFILFVFFDKFLSVLN